MGKWAEVPCACTNRAPVDGGDFQFDEPYRKKRRLSRTQRQERQEWERSTKDMYQCGHRNGMVVEFWPGDLIAFSRLVAECLRGQPVELEIFARVGNCGSYQDELLRLSPEEALAWLEGLTTLQETLAGRGGVGLDAVARMLSRFTVSELASRADLRRRLDQVAGTYARVQ